MKTFPFITSAALAAGVLVSVAAAQTASEIATPTPAPSIALPSTPAPAVAAQARPAPERIIYVPRLPSAADLTNVARAQGLTILQIDQTAADVTITYRFADGRTSTVAYQLLPDGGTAQPVAAVAGRTEPTVVYYQPAAAPAPRVVYYDRPAVYYDPFYYPWYGPVSLNLGFGYGFYGHGRGYFGGSYHGGGYRGGGHGHW